MGSDGWTGSGSEADAFFASFVDASPDVVAAVVAERGGNLNLVVGEGRAFGFWDRKVAARAAGKAERQRADATVRLRAIAAATRLQHPDETARLAPLPEASAVLLPAPRVVRLDVQERRETARFWARMGQEKRRRILVDRMRREVHAAEVARVRGERRERAAIGRWRLEQRAFERAQWQAVLAQHAARRRKRVANRWVAISEARALEIAIAALERPVPPQGRM